jgi:hypothetical protein
MSYDIYYLLKFILPNSMATVRINLPLSGQSWDLSREAILSVIPESLLGQALDAEPDVPEVTITHPDVTPDAMYIIDGFLEGREPGHHIPGLKSSARYLNLPWLEYYTSPLYDLVAHPFPGESWDLPENRDLLFAAAEQGDTLMVAYLLNKGVSPVIINPNIPRGPIGPTGPAITLAYLNYLNTHAPTQDRPIFNNPAITSPALTAALDNDQLSVIQILSASPAIASNINRLGLISAAIRHTALQIIQYLLHMTPDIPLDIFNAAINTGSLEMVKLVYPHVKEKVVADEDYANGFIANLGKPIWSWLLDQPEFKPLLQNYLEIAVDTNDVEMTGFLLNRTDPSFDDYHTFKEAVLNDRADIVWLFLTRIDPRLILNKHNLIEFVEANPRLATSQLLLADGRLFS